MIKAGVIGGSDYTAGELIRLLTHHPDVELRWVNCNSNAGRRVDSVHQGLAGELNLVFTAETPLADVNVVFLCNPHGSSRPFVEEHKNEIPADLCIIDLSPDFRVEDESHDFVYGLPELNRRRLVHDCRHVANPGSFATAIQLSLIPLAKNLLLNDDIHITGITGCLGADVEPKPANLAWRNDNVTVYKPFVHAHLNEVRQSLTQLQRSFKNRLDFIPMQASFARGVYTATYLNCPVDLREIRKLYEDYYDDHNFTFISDREVDLKDVMNTNKCLIHLDKIDGKLLITTVIDSLLKGACGTAVHNMNLLFGLHERVGLYLKASAF